jgi:molybdate transport system ATP-binding protein
VDGAVLGQRIQVQVLARDVIIATELPRGLSVRNVVPARVLSVTHDSGRAVLVELDIGRTTTLLARITERAADDLALLPDKMVWALIKAVSLRGHVFNAPAPGGISGQERGGISAQEHGPLSAPEH